MINSRLNDGRRHSRPPLLRALTHWPVLLPVVLVASVYHAWLVPGLITGEDFQRQDASVLATYFPWPLRWAEFENTGYSLAYWSPSAPLWCIEGGLTQLGLSWNLIERVVLMLPFLALSILGPYLLVYRLTRVPIAGAVAVTFFAFNTWTVGLTERGHVPSLVAYALMPFIFLMLMRFYARPSPLRAMALAALVTLQATYDVRYVYITFVVVGLFALSRWQSFNWRMLAPVAAGSGYAVLFWLVFNLYWLLPLMFNPLALPLEYSQLASFVGQSSFENLAHAMAMFFPFYHHATGTDPFKIDPVEPCFFAVPALVIASLATAWRRRWIPPLGLIIAFGVTVLAGPNTVIGFVVRFLFVYLPGMSIFRDITKFSSLVAFAYAMALAFGATRLVALLRLRFPGRAKPVAAFMLVVGLVAYALVMHDAYNPRRLSNFAPLPMLAQDLQLKRFLDTQSGYFRTAFYPTSRPYFVGTDMHPIVSIGDIANAAPFRGLAAISSNVSDPLALWRSPLMPALVREMNIRYFVIYDDPTGFVYRPFGYRVQRAEAQQFFRQQAWLREVRRFGGNVVYRVTGPSDARAFIAPTPLLYEGTATALDALAGTELWSDHGALILASQVNDHAILQYVHTLVRGPDSFDPRRPVQCPRCNQSDRRTADYSAVALTRLAMLDTIFGPPNDQQFKFLFGTGSGPTTLELHVGSDRHYIGSWSTKAYPVPHSQKADELFAIGSNAQRVVFDDSLVRSPVQGPGPGDWLGLQGQRTLLGLINPTPWSESADVVFPGVVSPDNAMRSVRFEMRGNSRVERVIGEFRTTPYFAAFVTGGGPQMTLHGLTLRPGITWLAIVTAGPGRSAPVGAAQSASLLLRGDVELANERFERSIAYSGRDGPMILSELRALDTSLAQHPRLWLHLTAPPLSSARLVVVLEDRSRRYAKVSRILRPGEPVDGEDMSAYVQAALDTMFSLEPKRYSTPLGAYLGNASRGPLEASSYMLRSAWIESLDPSPARARRVRVSEFTVGVGPGDLPPWSQQASPSADDIRTVAGTPLVAIDGIRQANRALRYDPTLHHVVVRLHPKLASGLHLLEGLTEVPFGIQSALLSQGKLPRGDGATTSDYKELTSAEYTGTLRTSGGLLVWPVSYDSAWALALIPKDGSKPTGNVILDWWRMRGHFLAADRHVPVNSGYNGWFVPKTDGRLIFLYVADAVSRLAAITWALLSAITVGLALLLSGGRRNPKPRQPRQRSRAIAAITTTLVAIATLKSDKQRSARNSGPAA